MEDFVTTAYNLQLQQLRLQQESVNEFVGVIDVEQMVAEQQTSDTSRPRTTNLRKESNKKMGLTKLQILEQRRREEARKVAAEENASTLDEPAAPEREPNERERRSAETAREAREARAARARARERAANQRREPERPPEVVRDRQPTPRGRSGY